MPVSAHKITRLGFYWPDTSNKQLHLARKGECWFRRQELQAGNKPEYLGPGTLSGGIRPLRWSFYLHKRAERPEK